MSTAVLKKSGWQALSINLLLGVASLVLFLGVTEWAFQQWASERVLTYFEEQTRQELGTPVPSKTAGEYRIFIFGGSAAFGFPLSERYSIAAWMRKSFPYLLPGKTVKVMNCGWPGKGSHHVLEGALNVMKYDPDLFIIYSGHNDATTDNRLYTDNFLYRLNLRLKFRSVFYRFLTSRWNRIRKHFVYGSSGYVEKAYREEVIAKRVYKTAEVSEKDYEAILERYHKNMEAVLKAARQRGVKILFLNLASNLRDVPPAFSSHAPGLSQEEIKKWDEFYERGKSFETQGRFHEALEAYKGALRIDPPYAELQYRLGIVHEAMGDHEATKLALTQARDLDRRPWRAKSSMNGLIRKLAKQHRTLFVDVIQGFERISPHGIIRRDLIHDDVHPSHEGQQLIAEQILRTLSRVGEIAPSEEWNWSMLERARAGERREEWEAPESLNAYGYILRGLHLWQQGRYQDVIPELEKGLELLPAFIESYAFLADAHFRTGNFDQAMKAFQNFESKDRKLLETLLHRYPQLEQSYTQSARSIQT